MPTILVTPPVPAVHLKSLASRYTISTDLKARLGVHAILCSTAFRADAGTLQSMPDLGIISCIGSGYENVDLTAATQLGIQVTNTAGANASAVADMAVGLVLASVRGIARGDRLLRTAGWGPARPAERFSRLGLTARHIGIVGLGRIGRKIADRIAAFETVVGYHGPSEKEESPFPFFASLIDLAHWADVLILAHRADAANRHMVNAEVLEALGPEGHLINVSRGSAVDEDALLRALTTGVIRGAGLDVFEDEPHVRSDLIALDNVVATPHLGGATRQSMDAMFEAAKANLDAYFGGDRLPGGIASPSIGSHGVNQALSNHAPRKRGERFS